MNFLFFIVFINIVIIFFKKNINKFINIKDVPDNKKKFHKLPVTPSGGLIFLVNLIIIFLYFHFFFNNYLVNEVFFQSNKSLLSFLFGSFALFLLGLLDDKYKLAPSIRLFFTFFFIYLVLMIDNDLIIRNLYSDFFDKTFQLSNLSIFFTILCFALFINAMNMFDGINCQSILYAIINFLIFYYYSSLDIFLFFVVSAFFLLYSNFKNYLFLGDSGVYLLSFIIYFFYIKFYQANYIKNVETILLYMLIPGVDMIRLFVLRLFNKKNPFEGDCNHLHHIILKKHDYKFTFITIALLVAVPIILSFFTIKNFLLIIISITIYIFLILNR
jgi:UDP-GlcNAc:undecaprenyl-phosphate GlcNAc-1-phosphate transferase